MNEKILVVDDEKELADLVEVYLKNDGYTVYKFYNGKAALKCIESVELDLAILDIMLPDIDGFQICQKIREKFYFPVIMLTAKVSSMDKINGLTLGNCVLNGSVLKSQIHQYLAASHQGSPDQYSHVLHTPRHPFHCKIYVHYNFHSLNIIQ